MRDVAQIRQEGDRVLLIVNGRLVLDVTWQSALEIGRGFIQKGKQAEEIAKVDSIIADSGLLLRAGLPFGLTNHPIIVRESMKFAMNDRALRRYFQSGIRSREAVGTPTIIKKEPLVNA